TDIPEAEMPPRNRACFTTPAFGFEVGESSAAGAARQSGPTLEADLRRDMIREIGYGITDTWDEIVETMLEIAPTTLERVNQRVTEPGGVILYTFSGYFSFGRHLDELHVTWAHLEKKRTRLRTNTKTLEDLCSQSLETASYAILDAVATYQVTASHISRRRQLALTQTQI
ncbi:hypothetical protein Tco_1276525, partial [Tanacetum coccineum]